MRLKHNNNRKNYVYIKLVVLEYHNKYHNKIT